ncbi:hypothetical protein Pint_12180 [Pistacia integerrima]|uniref:Uncharacterized protein n=1 Tax=Pistacia integerrima TaxID=434235 RepID=A0ACC0XI06_9ROSI|nr:hypothetical protein Pint_12180 [Pistacia integerrima]
MILSWLTHSREPDLAKGVIHAKTLIKYGKISKIGFHKKMHHHLSALKSLASFSQGNMSYPHITQSLKAYGMS